MPHYLVKLLLRFALFATSRHRLLGVRDWVASIAFIVLITVSAAVSIFFLVLEHTTEAGKINLESSLKLIIPAIIFLSIFAASPIAFILKLRRNGITDADYSVVSGINYKDALSSAHTGFDFMGVGASKLKAQEQELRDAVRHAERQSAKIRMILINPEAHQIFDRLEKMDSTSGYSATVKGAMMFFEELQKSHPNCFEIRLYKPNTIDEVKPLRLFFSDDDCLVSPFAPSTGERDQGRGLPQLRITKKGFPKKSDVTLYRSLKSHFESTWIDTEKN
ncbi:hypothetical protein K6V72_03110 [Ralstonia insidiosa]|jgi:hypothetical protein|uniref:Uncharacterized protein n=3 Tax=Burkholderiaceae TaxID=119060 RepID=A0A191ZUL0_9RALS|nr:hypothetical protein [Ralstonia insidiosa]ANJ71825.1 hypothetical protein A9Y76_04785 [Ralstonia insidiosa]KAB0472439.1 hypothetical protein F7R11_07660 [Ralstonia insidiosa]MBY4907969.1 hypothetical protein [Ralstonia insidiosa]